MAESSIQIAGPQQETASSLHTSDKRNPVRSISFKYYIHDGVDCCRLQLMGELAEVDIPDLNGCWNTVKTTLGNRIFLLDLRALRAADDAAKQWLARMLAEGATLDPENYLLDGPSTGSAPAVRSTLRARLSRLLRGCPAIEA